MLQEYHKATLAYVAADTEVGFLVGSTSPELEVRAIGQELAPDVDFENDAFNLIWD